MSLKSALNRVAAAADIASAFRHIPEYRLRGARRFGKAGGCLVQVNLLHALFPPDLLYHIINPFPILINNIGLESP